MAEAARTWHGLIDTSVVIDLDHIDAGLLPKELAVSALTMAELAAGPHATGDAVERARRQDRLQRAEATFDPLPFDARCPDCGAGVVRPRIDVTGPGETPPVHMDGTPVCAARCGTVRR